MKQSELGSNLGNLTKEDYQSISKWEEKEKAKNLVRSTIKLAVAILVVTGIKWFYPNASRESIEGDPESIGIIAKGVSAYVLAHIGVEFVPGMKAERFVDFVLRSITIETAKESVD